MTQRGIVYVPTGSATYDFYGADRLGQDLFANCLIAIDARTGKRLWHFQTVHHDLWDYDNVSAPQLVTVRHNGQRVDAVALAGKTGFLYVFNRVTGEPLWPIEERPVPKSDVVGEQAWPTQPFPDQTGAVRASRRSPSTTSIRGWCTPEQYAAMKARVAKARNEGPVHTARAGGHDLDAGQPGWVEFWNQRGESTEGSGLRRQRESGRHPPSRGREDSHC